LAKEKRVLPTKIKFGSSLGGLNVLTYTGFSVFEIYNQDWIPAFLFMAVAFLSLINIVSFFTTRLDFLTRSNLLLTIAGVTSLAYTYYPEFLTAVATVFGVASFIYLMIEKTIDIQ